MTTIVRGLRRFVVTAFGLRHEGLRGIGEEGAPPRYQVDRARKYLSENFEQATVARRSSFELKQAAARAVPIHLSTGVILIGEDLPNGALIEAAIDLGFRVEPRDNVNAWVFLKVKDDAAFEKQRRRGPTDPRFRWVA